MDVPTQIGKSSIHRVRRGDSFMTLRCVTYIIISLSTLTLVGVLYLVTRWSMITGFDKVEREETARHVQRVRDALNAVIVGMSSKTVDWAAWDDTARYVTDGNDEYVKSNLGPESIINLNVDAVIFIDAQGNLVQARGRADPAQGACDPPQDLLALTLGTPRIMKHPSAQSSVCGTVVLESGIWMLSSRPIVASDLKGPIRGTLVFARRISKEFVREIADQTHLDVEIYPRHEALKTGESPDVAEALATAGLAVKVIGDQKIAGFALIPDVLGNDSLVVQAAMPRRIYQEGMTSMRFQLLAITGTCVCVGVGIFFALSKLVVARVERMSRAIAAIATTGDLTRRVRANGRDELGVLGSDINAMLSAQLDATVKLQTQAEELREKSRQLEAANAKAEAAVQSKDTFLASISHEIRTPMTAILGFADMLGEDDVAPEDRRKYLTTIRNNGETLLTLIGDILDLAKMEAGGMTVELSPLNPADVVRDAYELLKPVAAKKGLVYHFSANDDVPRTISADPVRLKQIMVNLIGNALKFTSAGYVLVRLRTSVACTDGTRRLLIDVSDSGIGLTSEQISRLFVAFSQGEVSTSRRFGGTGLGLAISNRLATMMSGDIVVASEPGIGTTFTVSLGMEAGEGADARDAQTCVRASLPMKNETACTGRILVAEDGPDNQRLIEHILTRAGFDVHIVGDGKQAVEHVLGDSESPGNYDLVLMDMQMPVMDGYEAVDVLRRRGYRGPIVALSAHTGESARRKCLDAGCDDAASKPIMREEFIAMCRQWIEQEGRRKAA